MKVTAFAANDACEFSTNPFSFAQGSDILEAAKRAMFCDRWL